MITCIYMDISVFGYLNNQGSYRVYSSVWVLIILRSREYSQSWISDYRYIPNYSGFYLSPQSSVSVFFRPYPGFLKQGKMFSCQHKGIFQNQTLTPSTWMSCHRDAFYPMTDFVVCVLLWCHNPKCWHARPCSTFLYKKTDIINIFPLKLLAQFSLVY